MQVEFKDNGIGGKREVKVNELKEAVSGDIRN